MKCSRECLSFGTLCPHLLSQTTPKLPRKYILSAYCLLACLMPRGDVARSRILAGHPDSAGVEVGPGSPEIPSGLYEGLQRLRVNTFHASCVDLELHWKCSLYGRDRKQGRRICWKSSEKKDQICAYQTTTQSSAPCVPLSVFPCARKGE